MTEMILASASPRRKELLDQIGISYRVMPALCEEITAQTLPQDIVKELVLHSFYEVTDVYAFEMTDDENSGYIATGDPLDKAGAYGIQGAFAAFIKGVQGDYNNVVGLPVGRIYQELKNFMGNTGGNERW